MYRTEMKHDKTIQRLVTVSFFKAFLAISPGDLNSSGLHCTAGGFEYTVSWDCFRMNGKSPLQHQKTFLLPFILVLSCI